MKMDRVEQDNVQVVDGRLQLARFPKWSRLKKAACRLGADVTDCLHQLKL